MKTFIGTTALVFLAAMSTTATADSYQFTAQGSVLLGHDAQGEMVTDDFTITAIVYQDVIEEGDPYGHYDLYMTYQTSDVVFRNNGTLLDTSYFTYAQYVEDLDNGPLNRGVHVNFAIPPTTPIEMPLGYMRYNLYVPLVGEEYDTLEESARLHTYMDVSGGGIFWSQPTGTEPWLEIHSSSLVPLVPVPGLSALAPLAGIAAIRRRRRR